MDPRVEMYKTAFGHNGGAFPIIPVFQGTSRYQSGDGIGDVLKSVWRFFSPVAREGAKTLLKAGSDAMKEGASVKDIVQATLKPTLSAVVGATTQQIAKKILNDGSPPETAAPPVNPADQSGNANVGTVQAGSGRRRKRARVYKAPKMPRYSIARNERPILYNF